MYKMELQIINNRQSHRERSGLLSELEELELYDETTPAQQNTEKRSSFIEANTEEVTLDFLKRKCTIPVFSKDNESTIAHQEFIDVVSEAAQTFYSGMHIGNPEIRTSHVVKGRIPEAIGKPAKELLEHEKTIYYERMAFVLDIPGITSDVSGNSLSLTIGGVRAYNTENLYSKKTIEKFKVFVGFKNFVCTNLCISTDGFAQEIRVSDANELKLKVLELLRKYNHESHLAQMREFGNHALTEHQFAQFIGKTRLYNYLPHAEKKQLPLLEMNDGQLNAVARDYYSNMSFCREDDGNINLWKLYNLFTGATKSSYIDSFLSRTVNAHEFTNGIIQALNGDEKYKWFLN